MCILYDVQVYSAYFWDVMEFASFEHYLATALETGRLTGSQTGLATAHIM